MRARPVPLTLPAVGAAVLVLSVTLGACGGSAGPQAASGAAGVAGAGGNCRAASAASYAGQRPGDCVGYARYRFIVGVDGYEALMGNWKRYTDDLGRRLICAGVNVENLAGGAQPVSAAQFHLRDPSGRVETGRPAPSNGVPSRNLAAGIQQGGGVCWSDHGLGGRYVGSFEPAAGAGRGVWLVSFLPAG